ncbi:MAG: NYN domain-containing protein [Planctomycetes bacterium]|nr:NYN domain-containing protein [Planctomycetota bacterium]
MRAEAPHRKRLPSVSTVSPFAAAAPRERMLLIDGYNLAFARKERRIAKSSRSELQVVREDLLDLLAEYHALRPEPITVVFDGDKCEDPGPRRGRRAGIDVVFSPRHVNADTVIKTFIQRSAHPGDLRVVSTDREVGGAARVAGATPIESAAFLEHVRATLAPPPSAPPPDEPRPKSEGALDANETRRWMELFDVDGEVRLTDEEPPSEA